MTMGLVRGQVTAHDPPNGVRVSFRTTGQQISYTVSMGYDFASALTARQKPLPVIGSWGLIAIVNDDLRNAVWICAIIPSQMNALTTTQASGFAPADPHIDMQAHFSGDWWMMDGSGNYAHQWVDGSYFTAASGVALPKVYRRTVDSSQTQKVIEFTRTDRIKNPPANPNPYQFTHASGTKFNIDTSGSVTVSGASGATLNFIFGKSTVMIDVSGNVTVSGAAGATFTEQFGGTTMTIDASGQTMFNLASGKNFTLTQAAAAASDALVLVSKMVTKFNAHTHSGVQTGGGNTSTVVSPISASDIQSTVVKINA